ncbi:MAG: cytochrome c oxidase accessory protein CcoG [Rhizobiales bacterium]|nr:cytochrome c oxidase accessory protein CcoG [Hyphomicrobiales bacterium]
MSGSGKRPVAPEAYIIDPVGPQGSVGGKGQAATASAGDAAPGVVRHDVEAVNAKDNRELYAARVKVHPKRVRGTFRNLKWAMMIVALGIYYLLPWLRWDRGPSLPDQAFLMDFANQRLFFGPLEIWAQEFYYVTGILVVSALGLFLVTALAGRVWCGYACPQTVWTDLFVSVERFIQGDRNARLRLEKAPWTFDKAWKISVTHAIWLLISLATGGALVFYFRDAPTLAGEFVSGTAPYIAYVFLGVFTLSTYLLGGLAREQVCIYMCPWPRIQGAMFDDHSLLVSYRAYRGEPRGPHKKGDTWEGRGDCIDCKQCVVVCPMGIDIRDGPQLECIQCALCIDACNEIMTKVGRPANLIAYDTVHRLESKGRGEEAKLHLVRPRTLLYMVLIPIVLALMTYGWLNRSELDVSVLRDRNPLFVKLSDGGVRNGYTIKILNKRHETRRFAISLEGPLEGVTPAMEIIGLEGGEPVAEVVPDNLRALRVFISVPREALARLQDDTSAITFVVRDLGDGNETRRETTFRSPTR